MILIELELEVGLARVGNDLVEVEVDDVDDLDEGYMEVELMLELEESLKLLLEVVDTVMTEKKKMKDHSHSLLVD